ncbi:MAG TPA: metal-dependent hydrolase [Bacteroidota bacterium]|nr:metal-dependent hydrolase [Bacteroidota bacterium]
MFLGHFAVALASKKAAPRVSLGTLFFSVSLVDLLWPILLLLGLEHVKISPGITVVTPLDFYDFPITHSLVTSLGWSLLTGLLFFAWKKDLRSSVVVGLAVLSHWILDFLTHRPDLPLAPWGSAKLGLGLWDSFTATVILELALFVTAWYFYVRATEALSKGGRISLWSWTIFVVVIYFTSLLSPPPPNETALAYGGLAAWLFVPWGYWIDKRRTMKNAASPS